MTDDTENHIRICIYFIINLDVAESTPGLMGEEDNLKSNIFGDKK